MSFSFRRTISPLLLLIFLGMGLLLMIHAMHSVTYSEETDNYNLMWLDAWNLAFIGAVIIVWRWSASAAQRNSFILIALSAFGVVALSLIFSEAKFPVHAYWGDQKFRMTMIEQFMTTNMPSDYYYKELPVFYPPVFYYLLSLIARTFGLESYQVLRIAPHIIFITMPFLLYGLWRNILSAPRALFVTCAVMLVDVGGAFFSAKVPHAFIANSLFIPWWLHYLEGVKSERKGFVRYWLLGSVIGALLFSTYFYPFFIVGLSMPIQTIVAFLKKKKARIQELLRGWGVLAGSALLSMPLWLPVFLSVAKYGMDRSRADWYHDGTAGLNFFFLNFSWLGLCFLLSLIFFLYKSQSVLYRRILSLIGFTLVFVLLGSILGAFDKSLNLTKVRDFIMVLGGPAIGLGLFTLFRWSNKVKQRQKLVFGLLVAFLLITVQGTTALFRDPTVIEAKKTAIPNWGIPEAEKERCSHAVFLSGNEEFFAFFPAYAFIAINEHYSHPASRFIQRYDFLNLLQRIDDPYILNVALRHNCFDQVDYISPDKKRDVFALHASISNYPNKLEAKTLTYPCTLLEDSICFRRLKSSRYIFEVLPAPKRQRQAFIQATNAQDSAGRLNDLLLINDRLDSSGQTLLQSYIASNIFQHQDLLSLLKGYWYGDQLVLIGCYAFTTQDSVYLFSTFRVNRKLTNVWRIYLHISPDSTRESQTNFDFPAEVSTENWTTGDLITLCGAIPNPRRSFGIIMGFFNTNGQYGDAFVAQYQLSK